LINKVKQHKYRASKVTRGDITFDSKLESSCYELLSKFNIPFQFQLKVLLQPKFRDPKGKMVREINCFVDFVMEFNGTVVFLDTKGFFTDVSKLKYKMLQHLLFVHTTPYELVFVNRKKSMTDWVLSLKSKMDSKECVPTDDCIDDIINLNKQMYYD
jgi:hypothetical protein